MPYFIGELTLSEGRSGLEIDRQLYASLQRARSAISGIHRLELRREIVIRAFRDFERKMFDIALREKLEQEMGREFFSEAFIELNLSLNALLTSITIYVHQMEWAFRELPDSNELSAGANKLLNEVYDARFGFRIMEAMRNHSQHHELPISSVNYSGQAIENGPVGRRHRTSVDPVIRVEDLLRNSKFKKSLRLELENIKIKTIDVKHCVREYVSAIEFVHQSIRLNVREHFDRISDDIYNYMDEYAASRSRAFRPPVFFAWDSDNPDNAIYLGKDSIEETRRLMSTPDRSSSIRKSYISSEVVKVDTNLPD